jgi:hypothetical protein
MGEQRRTTTTLWGRQPSTRPVFRGFEVKTIAITLVHAAAAGVQFIIYFLMTSRASPRLYFSSSDIVAHGKKEV